MKAVTIRGVETEVSKKLKMLAVEQGKSVNQLILEIIKKSLGLKKEKTHTREYDDLDDLFGRWSQNEFEEVYTKIHQNRRIDSELWE